jgi:catechol 2,3-dioxygenase-like lactoylglutathione lyase family enzyme
MLGDKDAVATIAVKDLDVARKFYEGTLGLKPAEEQEPGSLTLKSGSSTIFLYESQYAGTNQATALTWGEVDVDGIVQALKAKGVKFEHYDDLPDTTQEGDVHAAGDLRLAWLKDPDGNILALAGKR